MAALDQGEGFGTGTRHAGDDVERSTLAAPGRLARRLELERDRWFLWLPVLYGAGVGLYFQLTFEPPLGAALGPLAIALALWAVLRRGTVSVAAAAGLLALAVGFSAAKLRAMMVAAPILERPTGMTEVRGWIELVEPRPTRGQRLTIRVASIRGIAEDRQPYRVRVRTNATTAGLLPGVPIRIRASLSPPAIPSHPGGYDFARSAFFQRLGGVGYALSGPQPDPSLLEVPLRLRLEARITTLRQAISERVRAGLAGERGGIADAMITGERGGITAATNQIYRDSGLFHILSISGLHMTIMAGAVFFALRFLLALVPSIALVHPVKKWAAASAIIAAFGYLLISGGSFATVRAWVMISIMFLAVLLDRPAIALRNVALSALLILAVLPESLLDIGFQMSFAAVAALVAAFEWLRDRQSARDGDRLPGRVLSALLFFGGIVLTTLIASFAVAPFGAYHFHTSQQYAILANLIAIPVCNIIVMPGALATLLLMPLGLEQLALWVMGIGIDMMTWCAGRVAALPGAVARLPAIPQLAFVLMVFGGLWLILWRTRWRHLGLAGIVAGGAMAPTLPRPDILVGHEGAVLAVRTPAGRLEAVASKAGEFELGRWLEYDGDKRQAREVTAGGGPFRCDASGCTATVKGRLVVLTRHASGLADDCGRAAVLIMALPAPQACRPQGPAIDLYDLRDKGTHAIYLEAHRIRSTTVAETRGERPWTGGRRPPGAIGAASARPARGSRLSMFAPPFDLGAGDTPTRPEIEDED